MSSLFFKFTFGNSEIFKIIKSPVKYYKNLQGSLFA